MQQGQQQRQHQSQTQWQLLHQIEGISLLSMPLSELQAAVRKAVEENPALEFAPAAKNEADYGLNIRTADVTSRGEEEAKRHQEAYENTAEEKETLQEHLLFQLSVMHLTPDETALGEKLIRNLDANGYHTLDPVTLLDKHRHLQNEAMLRRMISIVQHFDPEGTCCNNMEESLLIQAKIKAEDEKRGATDKKQNSLRGGGNGEKGAQSAADGSLMLALFILDGHINILYSTSSTLDTKAILRKLKHLQEKRRGMAFAAPSAFDSMELDEAAVLGAVSFISKLNPRPAQDFSRETTVYALPDVMVIRDGENSNMRRGIEVAASSGRRYTVSMTSDALPRVQLSKQFDAVRGHEASLKRLDAKSFIKNLEYRADTIIKAAAFIVRHQFRFFDSNGESPIEPLTQGDLARFLDVAKSTVSRMVTSKYLSAPWGRLYPMSHFFTNGQMVAKDAIQKIIMESKKDRPLSDREIANILARRGINIARRTVAKYRAAKGIKSSRKRKTQND